MYVKIAYKNATRSIKDYVLYMETIIVMVSIMTVSSLFASFTGIYGMESTMLPLLVALILFVLLVYLNQFMLTRKSKDLGVYSALGFNKNSISNLFLIETMLVGIICFFVGVLLGIGVFILFFFKRTSFNKAIDIEAIFIHSIFKTTVYYVSAQILLVISTKLIFLRSSVYQLIHLNKYNEVNKATRTKFISPYIFTLSLIIFICQLVFLVLGGRMATYSISTIAISVFFLILSFYQMLYECLIKVREKKHKMIYINDRLVILSSLLTKKRTNIYIDVALCVCLMFSFISFCSGRVFQTIPSNLFLAEKASFFSFIQYCISILFIIIYFSMLTVRNSIEARGEKSIYLSLRYMGKTTNSLKLLFKKKIVIRFVTPMIMNIFVILASLFAVNSLLNKFLLNSNNYLVFSSFYYLLVFIVLFGFYFCLAYQTYKKIILE